LLGRVFPQPFDIEGYDCERSFGHESRVLGRPAGRSILCGSLGQALSCVG
jgi:hypothetical protein